MIRLAHPEYLHLLWLLGLCVVVGIWSHRRWKKKRTRLGDSEQRNHILPRYILRNNFIATFLFITGMALWIIALTQPQYGSKTVSVEKPVSDVFIAIDVSRSMMAEDVKPNRLERTKIFSRQLLDQIGSERISIIPFAGHAYMNMPLTSDIAATTTVLEAIDENTASTPGTAIGEAINLAVESARELEPQRRVMILLTDGENHDQQAIEAAKKAADVEITIFPVGVGTEEGSRVPAPLNSGNRFLKDKYGSIVISKYNPRLLNDIASETGGKAYNILGGNRVIKDLKERIDKLDSQVLSKENFEVQKNYYGLFTLSGILCIIFALLLETYRHKGK